MLMSRTNNLQYDINDTNESGRIWGEGDCIVINWNYLE
jgi:hypothetical protein